MSSVPEIFIASSDASALSRLLASATRLAESESSALELSDKLSEARVVRSSELPKNTIRFRSTVTYEELPGHARRRVTLVSPREADASAGRISVLSPIGRALLGHVAGRVVDVTLPAGRKLAVKIAAVSPPAFDPLPELVYA
jgi:regulator of nucleoside diphosphate kinase